MKVQSKVIGIFWFILSLFISNFNDVLTKYIQLPPLQITSFRYIFGSIVLLPFLFFNKKDFATKRFGMHIIRGVLLAAAIGTWSIGLKKVHITSATLVGFTLPVFTLVLAVFILKEKVALKIWLITLVCFFGIFILFFTENDNVSIMDFILIFSALLFAILDITNKKYVESESMLSMLFYSSLFAGIICIAFSVNQWQEIKAQDIMLLALLGICSNLILYFLLLAYKHCAISFLAPLRYLEFLISVCMGYIVFQDILSTKELIAAGIIIPSTLIIAISQKKSIDSNT